MGWIQAQTWGTIAGVHRFSFPGHALCLVSANLFFLTRRMRSDGEKPTSSLEERERSRLESPRFLSSLRREVSVQVAVLKSVREALQGFTLVPESS